MKNISALIIFLCGISASAQTLNLDWSRTETYPQENANAFISIDNSNNDIVSGIVNIWVDVNNGIHANAVNRRDLAGQMVYDTVFDNNSSMDYRLRAFYPKNGEITYSLNYQNSVMHFEKLDASGQLQWHTTLPRSSLFFALTNDLKGAQYIIDDSTNNRKLWCFEQWDASYMTKSIGILATDNATGNVTIIDTINYPQSSNAAFAIDLERDNNGRVYMSSMTENGAVIISQLINGQLQTEATIDSAGFRDYGQGIRISGNTLFATTQVYISSSLRVNRLHMYSIGNNGQLTLLSAQTISDTQHFILGMKRYRNSCYVYTSGYQNSSYPNLVPTIWKYDGSGNLLNTFTLSSYTGKSVFDLSITDHALYCSMYAPGFDDLLVLQPSGGAQITTYNLLQEFSCSANDGAQFIEAKSTGVNSDLIYVAGNKWISQQLFARLAKFTMTGFPEGVEELQASPDLKISPNPANEVLTLSWEHYHEYRAELIDVTGRVIRSWCVRGEKDNVDLRDLSPGVYFVKLTDAASTVMNRFVRN